MRNSRLAVAMARDDRLAPLPGRDDDALEGLAVAALSRSSWAVPSRPT